MALPSFVFQWCQAHTEKNMTCNARPSHKGDDSHVSSKGQSWPIMCSACVWTHVCVCVCRCVWLCVWACARVTVCHCVAPNSHALWVWWRQFSWRMILADSSFSRHEKPEPCNATSLQNTHEVRYWLLRAVYCFAVLSNNMLFFSFFCESCHGSDQTGSGNWKTQTEVNKQKM